LVMPTRPAQNDDDADVDPTVSASLLAGPRNVKPYIARRGEQYMNKEQLDHFARILQNWKRDLMVEVDRTVLHMKDEAANFPDPNDRATQEEEFSLELRTRDRERKLRTVQDTGNLGVDRRGECEHVEFLGAQQRPLRNAVRLERGTDEGRGVEDNQPPGLRLRRSEL